MKWTNEQRYKKIEEMPKGYFDQLKQAVEMDKFYPKFHIAPPYGLLNDPNGLCFFNDEHHIFYQWCPLGAVHGLKYWYHVSTTDFINFKDHGIGIAPNDNKKDDYDSHGVYSGGAFVENNQAHLFFTGNKRDKNWQRISTQCHAVMNAKGEIKKTGIIIENSDYTEHFRDPKVWQENNKYYLTLGAQSAKTLHGGIVLYSSDDLKKWQHHGMIKTKYSKLGFMWECPDVFNLQDKDVMFFSPQGVDAKDKYTFTNIYNVAYLIGDLNLETTTLENHTNLFELDKGFDFYAPQSYTDNQGRRIFYAWVGLPEIAYPSDLNQWQGMLSIPRELSIQDTYLIQKPLQELQQLRQEKQEIQPLIKLENLTFELEFETSENFNLELKNKRGHNVKFALNNDEFELDRTNQTKIFGEKYGTKRYAKRIDKEQHIQLFFDHSVLEIFINNGKNTMTSRIYIENLNQLIISDNIKGNFYYLNTISGLN